MMIFFLSLHLPIYEQYSQLQYRRLSSNKIKDLYRSSRFGIKRRNVGNKRKERFDEKEGKEKKGWTQTRKNISRKR